MSYWKEHLRILQNGKNRFWQEYGYQHGKVRLRNMPEIFAMESTNYCNIKCIMCPRGEPDIMDRSLGHMSNELFHKIVDAWIYYTEPCWFHWFGEPLMNPRLYEQIAYAKKSGIPNLGISTNATLLDEKHARRILESGLDTIMIALDGSRKEVYERVRKSTEFTFEEVTENVRSFLALKKSLGVQKPVTMLSIIVMEGNRDQVREFCEYWKQQGADQVLEKPYVTWANQNQGEFVSLAPVEQIHHLRNAKREHPCKFLWESVQITWNGYVVPCCFDFNVTLVLGDLNKQSLREIWNGRTYLELRQKELNKENNTSLCRNCCQAPGYPRDPIWPLNLTVSELWHKI